MRVDRRSALRIVAAAAAMVGAVAGVIALGGCDKKARCKRCGMVVDAASRWRVVLRGPGLTEAFDTPKCAFTAWRSGLPATTAHFFGYYTQRELESRELAFVMGSDVLGPMGPDFVPVEPEHQKKFEAEHSGKRTLSAAEITRDIAEGL